jgi:hypothetical protein
LQEKATPDEGGCADPEGAHPEAGEQELEDFAVRSHYLERERTAAAVAWEAAAGREE